MSAVRPEVVDLHLAGLDLDLSDLAASTIAGEPLTPDQYALVCDTKPAELETAAYLLRVALEHHQAVADAWSALGELLDRYGLTADATVDDLAAVLNLADTLEFSRLAEIIAAADPIGEPDQ